jgi:hypothetical protein
MMKIWGKYQGMAVEEIDEADSAEEAQQLLCTYQLTFGADWTLWVGKKYPISGYTNIQKEYR